jgi:hypothetical protein
MHERGTLTQLNDDGKSEWSVRLGDASPSTGPVLLSDGTRAVLNHDNQLLRISEEGRVLTETPTGLRGKPSPLLPLADGGVAIAVGDVLLRANHRGEVSVRAHADAAIGMLFWSRGGVLAVAVTGRVFQFQATGKLIEKGHFNRKVAAVALSRDSLYAVTTDQQLVSVNLRTRALKTLFSAAPNKNLWPWLAIGKRAVFVATTDGGVRALWGAGPELTRFIASTRAAGGRGPGSLLSSAPVGLADLGNHLALAQAGSELLVHAPDGSYYGVPGGACLSPVALLPLATQSILLTCRNGELLAIAPRNATNKPTSPRRGGRSVIQ